jgi:hypothetical protein
MNILRIIIYCILLLLICFLTYSLATSYQVNASRNQVSFVIWSIDMIDLFIHETGHLIFAIFGRFIGFLGGSLFQVIIPVASVIVFGRSSLRSIPFTFYWTGQSMVNVSIYIGDAPYQRLQLISRGAIHDWRWILNQTGMMDCAADIALIVNTMGLFICCIGIAIGIYIVIKDCINLSSPASQA